MKSIGSSGHALENLFVLISDRDYQPASDSELLHELRRNMGGSCSDDDAVERRLFRPPLATVADPEVDVQQMQAVKHSPGLEGKGAETLDRVYAIDNARKYGGLIAGTGPDLPH